MDAAVCGYLDEIFGVQPKVQPWPAALSLPYFLQDAFDIRQMTLMDRQILLAVWKRPDKPSLAAVRGYVDNVRERAGLPVIYVVNSLASWERKRLIEYKVSFLVPGNQLYLPALGIDLREYFRQPASVPPAAFSPATQAVLLSALLRDPWRQLWNPAEVAYSLGYTAMTLSRIVRELAAAGIATAHTQGRVRLLQMARGVAQTWEYARPLMRSPVRRRVWVKPLVQGLAPHTRLAGLSALARSSMLGDPKWPVHAIGPAQWKAATRAGIEVLPEPLEGAVEWELWWYEPALIADTGLVDPLSLMLSLQDNADDRVQLALDDLKERFPW